MHITGARVPTVAVISIMSPNSKGGAPGMTMWGEFASPRRPSPNREPHQTKHPTAPHGAPGAWLQDDNIGSRFDRKSQAEQSAYANEIVSVAIRSPPSILPRRRRGRGTQPVKRLRNPGASIYRAALLAGWRGQASRRSFREGAYRFSSNTVPQPVKHLLRRARPPMDVVPYRFPLLSSINPATGISPSFPT